MTALLVAAGAVIGACLRHGVARVAPPEPGQWPVATFGVNLAGALLLGVLVGWLLARRGDRLGGLISSAESRRSVGEARLRAFAATGLLGSFTTFSALTVDVGLLVDAGRAGLALAYLVVTVIAGVAAARAGLDVGARLP